MKEKNKNFSLDEKDIADQVADEILTVEEDEDERRYFFLLLFFFVCLIFLVSTISFAVFNTYRNGTGNNVIDVGVDVDVDNRCTRNCDTDGDGICDKYCDKEDKDKKTTDDNGNAVINDNKNDSSDDRKSEKEKDKEEEVIPVNPETILFSFNEGSNYIDMVDVLPMSDAKGMVLEGDKEYFNFNVSVAFSKKSVPATYEVVAVPLDYNTLDAKNVRTYLTEDGKGVSILSNKINNFADLPNSKITKNGKVLYKRTLSVNNNSEYVFRMWLSSNAKVDHVKRSFGCKIIVNGYYDN